MTMQSASRKTSATKVVGKYDPKVVLRGMDFLKLGMREDDVTMIEDLETWLTKLPAGKGKSGKKSKGK